MVAATAMSTSMSMAAAWQWLGDGLAAVVVVAAAAAASAVAAAAAMVMVTTNGNGVGAAAIIVDLYLLGGAVPVAVIISMAGRPSQSVTLRGKCWAGRTAAEAIITSLTLAMGMPARFAFYCASSS